MKALVIARPQFPIGPEMAPMITQGALDWYERYKDRFEVFGTFMGGGGTFPHITFNRINLPRWTGDV